MADMPEDDAVVVDEEPITEEQAHEELVSKVTKLLEPEETPDVESEKPGDEPEETAEGEDEKEEPVELDEQLQSRVKQAGLTEETAKQLHQSGQLNEILTAFDRQIVQYVQSKQEPAKDQGQREQQPPPDEKELPALDPEVYDEAIVKRDAHHKQRIDALEARLEELLSQQQSGFDDWFDGMITQLGGNVNDTDKCQETFKVYGSLCQAFGTDPASCDEAMARRAYDVVHPEKLAKKTVDRLRDAEGKFLSKSPAAKGVPAKQVTDEQVHDELVANVANYLKEQGVQMSGY